jgi:ribonuclease HI
METIERHSCWDHTYEDCAAQAVVRLEAYVAELQTLWDITNGSLKAATHEATALQARVAALTAALREARQWIETGCDHFQDSEAVVRYLDQVLNAAAGP